MDFSQVRAKSLTETFIDYVEKLVISGELRSGEQLPPERELAERTGVSRPVVHESLVKLEARGLVTIVPRHGVFVSDYRSTGSLELLETLMNYSRARLDPSLIESLLDIRKSFEEKTAAMAAANATLEDLSLLEEVLRQEQQSLEKETEQIAEADFAFHQRLALASGSMVYPLILNSFRPLYHLMTVRLYAGPDQAAEIFGYHRRIVDAIMAHDAARSGMLMQHLLELTRELLQGTDSNEQ